jgi:MinD superfamily P-loop ATPase
MDEPHAIQRGVRAFVRIIEMILQVDPERCQRCDHCRLEVGCLGQVVERPDRTETPVINEEQCSGCGMCTLICPHDAVVEKLDSVHPAQRSRAV